MVAAPLPVLRATGMRPQASPVYLFTVAPVVSNQVLLCHFWDTSA
jgi:hypothetical protein